MSFIELPKILSYDDGFYKDTFKIIMLETKDYNYNKYDCIDLCFMIDSTGSM